MHCLAHTRIRSLADQNLLLDQVSSAGEVLYTLPANFKAIIRGRSWLLRSQPAFTAISNAAGYLVRVAFGAALIASVTLVWTTILAVMSSSSSSSDDRNRSCAPPTGFEHAATGCHCYKHLTLMAEPTACAGFCDGGIVSDGWQCLLP